MYSLIDMSCVATLGLIGLSVQGDMIQLHIWFLKLYMYLVSFYQLTLLQVLNVITDGHKIWEVSLNHDRFALPVSPDTLNTDPNAAVSHVPMLQQLYINTCI